MENTINKMISSCAPQLRFLVAKFDQIKAIAPTVELAVESFKLYADLIAAVEAVRPPVRKDNETEEYKLARERCEIAAKQIANIVGEYAMHYSLIGYDDRDADFAHEVIEAMGNLIDELDYYGFDIRGVV